MRLCYHVNSLKEGTEAAYMPSHRGHRRPGEVLSSKLLWLS